MFKKRNSSKPSYQDRPPKPKPQWTTDFTDPNKYKLSQAEIIQKKASLQSKNREIARHDLQERRKKLQMGIIDEDTRKVYQTALLSKKIDINPPIRKNLSQMIQYQRQRKDSKSKPTRENRQDQQGDNEFDQQIKRTKAFIKKMQKAAKQDQIHKAVQILEGSPRYSNLKSTQMRKSGSCSYFPRESTNILRDSCDQLSSIQETMKFMEEQILNKKKNKDKVSQLEIESFNNPQQENTKIQAQKPIYSPKFAPKNEHIVQRFQENQLSYEQMSQLRLHINQQPLHINEDDCLDTIRRMKQLIQSKEHLYNLDQTESRQKQNNEYLSNTNRLSQNNRFFDSKNKLDSSAEIDFSLTMNDSDIFHKNNTTQKQSHRYEPKQTFNIAPIQVTDNQYQQYQDIKKSLFEEVSKLKNWSSDAFQLQLEKQREQHLSNSHSPQIFGIEQQEYSQIKPMQKKPKKPKSSAKKQSNIELEKIKNSILGTQKNVECIKVQTIGVNRNIDTGYDFRSGSINIMKNLLQ